MLMDTHYPACLHCDVLREAAYAVSLGSTVSSARSLHRSGMHLHSSQPAYDAWSSGNDLELHHDCGLPYQDATCLELAACVHGCIVHIHAHALSVD